MKTLIYNNEESEDKVFSLLSQYFSFKNGSITGPKSKDDADFVHQKLWDYENIIGKEGLKKAVKDFLIGKGIKDEMELIDLIRAIINK